MKKLISSLLTAALVFSVQPASAAISPVSIAIVPPVQFPPDDFQIAGLRLSVIYGKQRDIYGFDFGVVGNITDQDFVGLGLSGLFNITRGNTTIIGLQAAGIGNFNSQKTNVFGLQVAAGVNSNSAEGSVNGIQFALANLSPNTTIRGVQAGVYNKARSVYGFQIGLVNVANDLHGIQIGLLNYHTTGMLAVSPIINAGF